MTADEKARWALALKRTGEIIHRLSVEVGDSSPFMKDMKALQDELYAIPDKPDQDARRLGEQIGSAVSDLVGKNATVNVYVTVNGK